MSSICLHNAQLLTGETKFILGGILIEDEIIVDIFFEDRLKDKKFKPNTEFIDLQNAAYIAPGLIDTHIHGFGGYGVEDHDTESLLHMALQLSHYGVTSFFPTIYPETPADFLTAIRTVSNAMDVQNSGARILGSHLEGPFISPLQSGALPPEHMQEVNIEFLAQCLESSRNRICTMTVAPELKGMHELALYCQQHDICLQIGHTNAKHRHVLEGLQVGIRHATHMFNAMRHLHHRDPGTVGSILTHNEISCELIADTHHVAPEVVRLLLQYKPAEQIVLVSDALKPTKQKKGTLLANNKLVYREDGVFKHASDGVIAGSCLTLIDALKNISSLDVSLTDAIKMATSNPARIFKLKRLGVLRPGYLADIIVFDKDFTVLYTMINGTIINTELPTHQKEGSTTYIHTMK